MMLSERKRKFCAVWLANLQCTDPILQMYLCVTEIATCKQLKEGIVLNIFCFITQKNISKGFHGKNTWNFVSPCSHQGEQCSWIRLCVARGSNYK